MTKAKHEEKSVDEYLAAVPDEARATLEKLRKTIKSVVPDAVEGIGYGVVVFKYKGRGLVGYGASKNHCAFYLMSTSIIPKHRDILESYESSGGTIRFEPGKPLPASLVKTLVKARITENEALAKKK